MHVEQSGTTLLVLSTLLSSFPAIRSNWMPSLNTSASSFKLDSCGILVNELSVRGSAVISFILKPPLNLMLRQAMEHNMESRSTPVTGAAHASEVEELRCLTQHQKRFNVRELLVVCALREMSKTQLSETKQYLTAILIVHMLLLKNLALA